MPPNQFRTPLIAGALCLIPAGCGEPATIRQYVVPGENQQHLTSDLLRNEFPPIPFRWDIPQTWDLASNDQFSVRAWKAGPSTKQARITLGQFPARTGIPAQVMRWRRQLGLKTENEDAAMQDVKALRTQNGAGSFATIEGTTETILAFIVPIESQFWIFRFKGPNSTASTEDALFRRFCKSLEYVKPTASAPTTIREPNPSLPSLESRPQSESGVQQITSEPADNASHSEEPATKSDSSTAQPGNKPPAERE